MAIKPRKKSGFTLVEVIISMSIIGILSVGVYGAYLMLIRQTKDGEVKQGATLVGKKISEEIKANGDRISENAEGKIQLTDTITLNDDKTKQISLDKYGDVVDTESNQKVYIANIELEDKNTNQGNTIKISEEDYNKRLFIVGDTLKSDSENDKIESSDKVEKTIQIDIMSNISKSVEYEGTEKSIEGDCVVLDFKYMTNPESQYTINVKNETSNSFKLFVLNSKKDENPANITVENEKGILYEYYRRDYEKSGKLYIIKLNLQKANGVDSGKELFETEFTQNINVD